MSIELAVKRLKDQVPLASLIRETTELKQKSGRLQGLCPFHNEKTPSFYVFDNNYYCFGCHAKGDSIEFVMKTQGLGFIDALKYLSSKFNIALPELEQSQKRLGDRMSYEPLYKCFLVAQELYVKNLESPAGAKALEYLKSRGFSEENIKAFGFGVTFDSYSQLADYYKKNGVNAKDAMTVNLLRESQRPGQPPYDFFRNRLMIPIRDQFGRIVGMGGRTLTNDSVKYVNSQNHLLYDKKSVLFGLDHARKIMKSKNRAIVVEGYMDALQLWQHGFHETAAVLGTSLSLTHLHQVSNSTQNLYLVFDGDSAGQAASLRTVDLVLQVANLNVKIVQLPNNDDPDSYLRAHGAEAFEKQLAGAQDLLEFAIRHEIKQSGNMNLPETINKKFIPWLSAVEDPIKRGFLVHKVSEQTGISKAEIENQIRKPSAHVGKITQTKEAGDVMANELTISFPGKRQIEILGHLYFAQPGELDLDRINQLLVDRIVLDPFWLQFARELVRSLAEGKSPSELGAANWQSSGVPEIFELLDELAESKQAFAVATIKRMALIESLIADQTIKKIKAEIVRYKEQISLLAQGGQADQGEIISILGKIDQLNKNLNSLGPGGGPDP